MFCDSPCGNWASKRAAPPLCTRSCVRGAVGRAAAAVAAVAVAARAVAATATSARAMAMVGISAGWSARAYRVAYWMTAVIATGY